MNEILNYPDQTIFVSVTSTAFGNTKVVESRGYVDVIFVQNTQYRRDPFQDALDSDAICYPDINNDFIQSNYNRLEGMYILMPLYGASDEVAWFKVVNCTVNRDHLIDNSIDNIELRLKKTEAIAGVS